MGSRVNVSEFIDNKHVARVTKFSRLVSSSDLFTVTVVLLILKCFVTNISKSKM